MDWGTITGVAGMLTGVGGLIVSIITRNDQIAFRKEEADRERNELELTIGAETDSLAIMAQNKSYRVLTILDLVLQITVPGRGYIKISIATTDSDLVFVRTATFPVTVLPTDGFVVGADWDVVLELLKHMKKTPYITSAEKNTLIVSATAVGQDGKAYHKVAIVHLPEDMTL